MGTYTIWIATGKTAPAAALSQTYDETENDHIPGCWPGLSYDCAQIISTRQAIAVRYTTSGPAGRPTRSSSKAGKSQSNVPTGARTSMISFPSHTA